MLAIFQVVDQRYEEAIDSAKRAVALGPGDVEAHVALGYVYLFAGKFAEAAAAIETALKLDPNLSPIDRQVAGLVYFFKGDNDRAIAALERARDEAPGVGNILIALAPPTRAPAGSPTLAPRWPKVFEFPPNYRFHCGHQRSIGRIFATPRTSHSSSRRCAGGPPRMAVRVLRRRATTG